MKGQSNDYSEYEELHEHPITSNYEAVSILDTEYLIRQILMDRDQHQLIVNTKTFPIKGDRLRVGLQRRN